MLGESNGQTCWNIFPLLSAETRNQHNIFRFGDLFCQFSLVPRESNYLVAYMKGTWWREWAVVATIVSKLSERITHRIHVWIFMVWCVLSNPNQLCPFSERIVPSKITWKQHMPASRRLKMKVPWISYRMNPGGLLPPRFAATFRVKLTRFLTQNEEKPGWFSRVSFGNGWRFFQRRIW